MYTCIIAIAAMSFNRCLIRETPTSDQVNYDCIYLNNTSEKIIKF